MVEELPWNPIAGGILEGAVEPCKSSFLLASEIGEEIGCDVQTPLIAGGCFRGIAHERSAIAEIWSFG